MANHMTEYQREELRLREKEIELKSEALSLQRKWYRNPTIIAGIIMAYVTIVGSTFSAFQSRKVEDTKIVLEETRVALACIELATKIIHEPDSSEEEEQWARRIFQHFQNAPFRFLIKEPLPLETTNK